MKAEARFRHVPVAEARSRAAHGGYRGLQQDEVDVVLCDEVSDHRRLEALVGRPLLGLDEALDSALRGLSP